jgi:maltose 6'-phosphate phosphatase
MKLLTLNCHSWQEEKQFEKIKVIAKSIKEKSYDVIALQEVSQSIEAELVDDKIKEDNFALILLKELEKMSIDDYKMIWDFSNIGFDIYEEGLAILTKHKIVKEESFFVSKKKDPNYWKARKVVGATIRINEQLIDFYSCHLGWWDDEEEPFQDQVDLLFESISCENLTFLLGDFNNDAFVSNEGYDYLMDKGIYDTFDLAKQKDKGVTVKGKIDGWDENKQNMRLDLILVNKLIDIKSFQVIFNNNNKPVVSDHYGVEVEL